MGVVGAIVVLLLYKTAGLQSNIQAKPSESLDDFDKIDAHKVRQTIYHLMKP
ncbi:MAG: hypothetical protein JST09_02655 [Bacteroidetes bacterium]|nr:hypothetical protein [Bacteroidota bacterium]